MPCLPHPPPPRRHYIDRCITRAYLFQIVLEIINYTYRAAIYLVYHNRQKSPNHFDATLILHLCFSNPQALLSLVPTQISCQLYHRSH